MRLFVSCLLSLLIMGCAQTFPRPDKTCCADGLTGNDIFGRTFLAHGGAHLQDLKNLSVDVDGDWKYLITRIQPLVTDSGYRVRSREVVFPPDKSYHASFDGPLGNKWVFRRPGSTEVFYNGVPSNNEDDLLSTALTADSFYIFTLGPLGLPRLSGEFVRLQDATEGGRKFYRIYAQMTPGIGESERDEIVLWVDPETWLTFRVHITLEGYETTKGAHVDVTFNDYAELGDFVFPSAFFERVLGPINIDAHEWHSWNHQVNQPINSDSLPRPKQ